MALGTVNVGNRSVPGATSTEVFTHSLDNSYPAGGYTVNASTYGFTVLKRLLFNAFTTVAGAAYELAFIPTYNTAANDGSLASVNIRAIVGTTGLEVGTGVNVSTVSFNVIAEGN